MTRRIDNGSVVPESQLVDAVDGDGNPVNLTEIANGKDVKVPYNDGTNRVRVYRGTSGERVYTISVTTEEAPPQRQQASSKVRK